MHSNVAETFRDGTVLITGSTGFLGKILTEKLLRSSPIRNIAVLVRSKKGLSANQRVTDIYKENVCIILDVMNAYGFITTYFFFYI